MNTGIIILVVAGAAFLGGLSFGYIAGLTKGMSLAMHFRTDRPVSPLPWILSFAASGAFLVLAIGSLIYTQYFLSRSVQTTGTVIEIVERTNDDGDISRLPVYEYRTDEGVTYKKNSSMSDATHYEVGDALQIRYLASSPHKSRIDKFSHHWFLPIVSVIASVFLVCLGFGLRWWKAKEQKWANKRLGSIATTPPKSQS